MSSPTYKEFMVSNELLDNPQQLRERLQEKGYLFFRELVKPELSKVRSGMMAIADKYGYIREGSDPADGLYKEGQFGSGYLTSPLYREMLDLDSFNGLPQTPVMLQLFEHLLESEVQEHRRRVIRLIFPDQLEEAATPPHQDFLYIKGTEETYTAWMPITDCPRIMGGLAVLEGSHRVGHQKHEKMYSLFGITDDTLNPFGLQWATTDFQMGDVLIFHSMTIHKALPNRTQDRLRISLDYRYQRKKDPIEFDSMEHHWETVKRVTRDGLKV